VTTHRLQPLIAPASLAVVGASRREGAVGNEVLVNLLKGAYPGALYAVNPGYDEIMGIACFSSLADLPEIPQHVIFALGDAHIESALGEAVALGIPAATIYSALLLEGDTQPPLKSRIETMARDAGMLLAGANGMGIYNFREHFWNCGFDTREHSRIGNVVLLSQSGSGMSGILDCEERIDFLFAASTGQELLITMEDYLDYVLDLPETKVVGMFMETSRQPEKLVACLQKAADKQIPVVVLKVGKTELSAELAVSHSGAMTGTDASYQAIFNRYGVQRVRDMDELATALIMFAQPFSLTTLRPHPIRRTAPTPEGRRVGAEGGGEGIVTLHDSGGERQLIIDLAESVGVPFAQISEATIGKLEELLDPGLPPVNPLDAWGAGGADADDVMAQCMAALLSDDNALLGAVVHDRAPGGKIYQSYVDYMEHAHAATGKPIFLVASRQGTGADERVLETTRRGFPVLDGVSQFLAGARCLLDYHSFLQQPAMSPPFLSAVIVEELRAQLAGAGIEGSLGEYLSSALLTECGLIMNDSMLINSAEELTVLLDQLVYPVALKTAAVGMAHKSDSGGVLLNISDAQALQEAYADMASRLGAPVLVAPMISGGGIEMILGVARDPQFGPMVVLGFGGIYAEVMQDVTVLAAPFDAAAARRALDTLRMRPLLDGVRGEPPVDIDAYCEMAARLSALAHALRGEIREVDINPVKVASWGVVGLDALVICDSQEKECAA
jgi:acyl-CoA synthetase (NDP forming)